MAVNAGPEGRFPDGGHGRRLAGGTHAEAALASRSAATPSARTAMTAAALAATLGLAAACWVIAAWQMNGMDMGVATRLGPFGVFTGVWVAMMAAMMLPGAVPRRRGVPGPAAGHARCRCSSGPTWRCGQWWESRCTRCTGRMGLGRRRGGDHGGGL